MLEATEVLDRPRHSTISGATSNMLKLVIKIWGQNPKIARARMAPKPEADKNWNLRCRLGDVEKVFCAGSGIEGNGLRIKNQFMRLNVLIPLREISEKMEKCKGKCDWAIFETSSGTIRIGCGSLQKIMQLLPR